MFKTTAHRLLDGITALVLLGASGVLLVLASKVPFHDGNYALFYLGFGVLLECIYLATHFALAAILCSRRSTAERISRFLGILLMVPLGLIILVLGILLEQSIRLAYEQDEQITNWVIVSLVVFLLVVPAFLICRYILLTFFRQRAEQALGADS